jgi:hypothetical protein
MVWIRRNGIPTYVAIDCMIEKQGRISKIVFKFANTATQQRLKVKALQRGNMPVLPKEPTNSVIRRRLGRKWKTTAA